MKSADEWVDDMIAGWPDDCLPPADDERAGIAQFLAKVQEDATADMLDRVRALLNDEGWNWGEPTGSPPPLNPHGFSTDIMDAVEREVLKLPLLPEGK
jgi:hypothetical protein